MVDSNIMSSRKLLTQIAPRVRNAGKRVNKDAWVICTGANRWDFHGPNGYHWYGHADNSYEARYKGWSAWLNRNKGVPQ